jgi:hypothetical protein
MDTEAKLLLSLVAAHLLSDFLLQSRRLASRKSDPMVLAGHALVVAAASYVSVGAWSDWRIPVAVFAAHGLIDYVKMHVARQGSAVAFLIDQAAHLVSLWVISHWLPVRTSDLYWLQMWGGTYLQIVILFSGLVVAVKVSGILLELLVEPYLRQLRDAGRDLEARGLRNGGAVIGQIERSLIFVFVIAGHASAVGFLIAAKSVLRFGEVRDPENRMEAEYIIIGTLLSFTLGSVASFGCRYLLSLTG